MIRSVRVHHFSGVPRAKKLVKLVDKTVVSGEEYYRSQNMFYLKQYNYNFLNSDRDQWIDVAFPVTTLSIILAIVIPGLFIQIAGKFNIVLNSFSRVVVSLLSVQLFFIIPLLFVALLTSGNITLKDKLGLINWKNGYWLEVLGYELILFFPLMVIAAVMFFFVSYFGLDTSSPIATLLLSATTNVKILVFAVSVFLAPIIEEIVFRRVVFTFINRLFGVLPALVITSFVFGVLHGGIVQLIPLMILGVVLQILYLKHNSLYPSILLHSLHNFLIMSIFLTLGV